MYNLRGDPFERGDVSLNYDAWMVDRAFMLVPSQAIVARWIATFREYPIRQRPASFNLDEVMTKLAPKN